MVNHGQVTQSELDKLLTEETLSLYISQGQNIRPLVDIIDEVVRFCNNLEMGFGKYVVNQYDGRALTFRLFGFEFCYELYLPEAPKLLTWPCEPIWELDYSLWDDDSNCLSENKDKGTTIKKFDLTKDNSTEPILRVITAHLYTSINRILGYAYGPLK